MREKKIYDLEYIQKQGLQILIVFDNICRKNKINYSLCAGTLLGAVRHKGFIPWDDDVDVMMTRDNYNKFILACEDNLPDGFFLQTFRTDKLYLNGFAKLLNLEIEAYITETEKMNIKHALDIDIFPVDRCPEKYIYNMFDIVLLSICSALKYSQLKQRANFKIKVITRFISKIIVGITGTYRINCFEEKVKTKYYMRDCRGSFVSFDTKPPYKWRQKDIYPFSLFDDYDEVEFEGHKFMSIKEKNQYLTITYGDYMQMPPLEQRVPMHNFYYYLEENDKNGID